APGRPGSRLMLDVGWGKRERGSTVIDRRPPFNRRSENADARRLHALRAGLRLEVHRLALFQAAVARALDSAEVGEDVSRSIAGLDEAEALFSVEPLDGTCSHTAYPLCTVHPPE